MPWWEDDAELFLRRRQQDEATGVGGPSEEEARRAAVYTREDLSLVVSYLSALNLQVSTIKNILIYFLLLSLLSPIIAIVIWVALRAAALGS